jgi:hypothetical protein
MTTPANIDQIVQDILADMSLKEKAAIANLDKDKVPLLQPAFPVLLSDKLGVTSFQKSFIMQNSFNNNRIHPSLIARNIYLPIVDLLTFFHFAP